MCVSYLIYIEIIPPFYCSTAAEIIRHEDMTELWSEVVKASDDWLGAKSQITLVECKTIAISFLKIN